MKRPVVTVQTDEGPISLRMDANAVASLDAMARKAGVSRSAMAERLIVEGLQDPNISEVREEVREARRQAQSIKVRLLAAIGREVAALKDEVG
jgi:hypothetical protein